MSKIIFTQYLPLNDQFEEYADYIENKQRNYALKYGATYALHTPDDIDNYDDLQLNKILLAEKYAQQFDQVLYIDYDVIPTDHAPDIFKKVNGLSLYPTFPKVGMREYDKLLDKQMMLASEGRKYNNIIYNTGVFHCDKASMEELKFSERFDECKELCSDFNNEVYISYIIERYGCKHNFLPMCWNYILDGFQEMPNAAGYFHHYHHKKFWCLLPDSNRDA